MTRTQNKRPLKEQSIEELKNRVVMTKGFLDILMNDDDVKDDERAPDAIHNYEMQLEAIEAEIERRTPQPIVIGLQPGKLFGTSPSPTKE